MFVAVATMGTLNFKSLNIILILLIILNSLGMASAWWDANWQYRMPININNTGNSYTLTNHTIYLNVTYEGGMNLNFSDIRIVDEVNSVEVPYWIQNKVDGKYAEIWFSASTTPIPANSWLNNTYYLYYGNPSATSNSNGTLTFLFFDDFSGKGFNLEPIIKTFTNLGGGFAIVRYENGTPVRINGHRYTAYFGADDESDPDDGMCIAWSDDGSNWTIEICGIKAENGLGLRYVGTALYFPDSLNGYKYWIYGSGDNLGGTGQAVWLIRSNDGINFTDYHKIWYPGQKSGWDSSCHSAVTVIKIGNTWHAWYQANDDVNNQIGYATSSDGINWVKYGNPVIPYNPTASPDDNNQVMQPCVWWNGSKFIIFYRGSSNNWSTRLEGGTIFWGVSDDGINWDLKGAVLTQNPDISYESYSIGAPAIIDYDKRLIVYAGNDGVTTGYLGRFTHYALASWDGTTLTRNSTLVLSAPFDGAIGYGLPDARQYLHEHGWTTIGENISIVNGVLNILTACAICTNKTFDTNFSVSYRGKENTGYWMGICWNYIDSSNYYRYFIGKHATGSDDYLFGKIIAGEKTNWVSWSNIGTDTRKFNVYSINRYINNHSIFVNGIKLYNITDNSITSPGHICLLAATTGDVSFDYVFVRKFIDPDPTAVLGTLETLEAPTTSLSDFTWFIIILILVGFIVAVRFSLRF